MIILGDFAMIMFPDRTVKKIFFLVYQIGAVGNPIKKLITAMAKKKAAKKKKAAGKKKK